MPVLSLRQYAKHRGVALSAVQKAIQSGRISTLADGKIDPDTADVEWAQNTAYHAPPIGSRIQDAEDVPIGSQQYNKARAVREHYQARLAKLEFEERTATLVRKDEVQAAAFNKFRQFRDHILNIPDRVAAVMAAETDAAKCYEFLATEVRRALNEFADSNS